MSASCAPGSNEILAAPLITMMETENVAIKQERKKAKVSSDKKPLLQSALKNSNRKADPQTSSSPSSSSRKENAPRAPNRMFGLTFRKKPKQALADSKDEDAEDDPVMALFNARQTQRVRFSLETTPESEAKYETIEDQSSTPESRSSIKKFMKGALFTRKKDGETSDEYDDVQKEIDAMNPPSSPWPTPQDEGEEVVVRARPSPKTKNGVVLSFTEDTEIRAQVIKLLNKATRAQSVHFRYEYAVKSCMKALELLGEANYPDDHPLVIKTMQSLNNAHHILSSYENSANIVKMGIKHEDNGDLVRALKMYTIAYRIRRDNLSPNHPSLAVLLNMLGSIQVKRDELEEAMEIYELALKDDPILLDGEDGESHEEMRPPTNNLLARSVAFREMGTIYERWGEQEEALKMYHKSLDCVAEYKGLSLHSASKKVGTPPRLIDTSASTTEPASPTAVTDEEILLDLENVQLSRSYAKTNAVTKSNPTGEEDGGMELFIGAQRGSKDSKDGGVTTSRYDVFFPPSLDKEKARKKGKPDKVDIADVDVALTLHQIGQMHRIEGEYNLALAAYSVALRGMKHALGKNHPNVAAILGNIGNLQKEIGDMNSAFETYQQVLAIESVRLGLAHPDVAITLHNIATIDAARGNHESALSLYEQVMQLQQKLFGEDHVSIAVTSACMGDVYERVGDLEGAVERFEEALRIKTATLGRHSLDVARILHKLGKLAVASGDFHLADSYLSRTVLIYRLNKLPDDDEWVIDANRDVADIDAVIAMGRATTTVEF